MRHKKFPRRLLVGLAALVLSVAACAEREGGGTTIPGTAAQTTTTIEPATTTSPPSTTTTSAPMTGHIVYFLLEELDIEDGSPGPYLVPVYKESPASDGEADAALRLLLEGPSEDEISGIPPISTAIPEGTSLLGVTMDGGSATIDLSGEFDDGGGSFGMFARLAQVVYTATGLADVDEVVFVVDGEEVTVFSAEGIELDRPQQRDDYYDLLPPIFVDSPAWGQPVISPLQVQGLSNVFEATSQVMLTDDDGLPLYEHPVMATCGTGCWGDWHAEIPYTVDREQFGALIVWELSAKDGSRINIREYPIILD
jgi:spore germination protein GerM